MIQKIQYFYNKIVNKINFLFYFIIFKLDGYYVYFTEIFDRKFKKFIPFIIMIFILFITYYFKKELTIFLSTDTTYKALTSLTLSLGIGFIGVIAMIFALIIFSLQVNIERLPYDLFYNLSNDKKLITYFGITFFLAIFIAGSSLIEQSHAIFIFIILLSSLFIILYLLYHTFFYALKLINPDEQLNNLIYKVELDLNWWEKRFKYAKPLLNNTLSNNSIEFDRKRFIELNPNYFNSVENTLNNLDFMIKKNIDFKDYFILDKTLISLVEINKLYIKAKGKTFLEYVPYSNNDSWNDKIINKTLKILRISFSKALNNNDEIVLIYIQRCYIELTKLYLTIPYSKIQAEVSSQHLIEDIEKILFLKNPDLLMNSIQNMEVLIIYYIEQNILIDTNKIIKTLGLLGNIATHDPINFPIVQTAMNSLTKITYELIQSQNDIGLILEEINKQVNAITSKILQQSLEFTSLGNYFGDDNNSLIHFFMNMANKLLQKENISTEKKYVLKNILIYAEKSYSLHKNLYLKSLENESLNNFNFLSFILKLSELLLFLSKINFLKRKFEHESKFYLSIISCIPETIQSIKTSNRSHVIEKLFNLAKNNIKHKSMQIIPYIIDLLIKYSFKVAKYDNENIYNSVLGLLAISYLKLELDNIYSEEQLLKEISNCFTHYNIPYKNSEFICTHFEKIIKGKLKNKSMLSDIEKAILSYEEIKINTLLNKIKNSIYK